MNRTERLTLLQRADAFPASGLPSALAGVLGSQERHESILCPATCAFTDPCKRV